jgi:hypothetical protein
MDAHHHAMLSPDRLFAQVVEATGGWCLLRYRARHGDAADS